MTPLSQGPAAGVTALAGSFSMPDVYVTAGLDGRIGVYGAQDHGLRQVLHQDPTAGLPLCLDVAGGLVVSGWGDGAIRAHPVAPPPAGVVGPRSTTPALWTLPGAHTFAHSCGTTAVCVAGRGHLIASGGMGGEVRVWNARSREMVGHIKHHGNRVNHIQLLSDDTHLVAACEDHSLSAIDMATQKLRATWRRSTPIRGLAACADQVRGGWLVGLRGWLALFLCACADATRLGGEWACFLLCARRSRCSLWATRSTCRCGTCACPTPCWSSATRTTATWVPWPSGKRRPTWPPPVRPAFLMRESPCRGVVASRLLRLRW